MTDDFNKLLEDHLNNIKNSDLTLDRNLNPIIGITTTDALGKLVKVGDIVSLTHKGFGAAAIGIVKEITKTRRVRAYYCLYTPRCSDWYCKYGNHRFFSGKKQFFLPNQIIKLNGISKEEPILQELIKAYTRNKTNESKRAN